MRYGLGKRDAALAKAGHIPQVQKREKVRERLRQLRYYRWSSTRAYLAVEAAPSWLTMDVVRAQFGGRTKKDQIRAYRQALEEARGGRGLRNRDVTPVALRTEIA